MSNQAKRYRKEKPSRANRRDPQMYAVEEESNVIQLEFSHPSNKPIEALTATQEIHKSSLLHDDIVIAIGSAGTGKTYLASAVAAELYKNKHVKQLILTRPNIETGPSLGALPGELEDKFAPYMEPFQKGIVDRIGSNKFKADYKKRILAKPLNYMRGATFDDAILMLDEAQNVTVNQMKMFLTRAGTNSKIFITGDVNQTDLRGSDNGLAWLIGQITKRQLPIDIIRYNKNDCVRSGLCKDMLDLIENEVDLH